MHKYLYFYFTVLLPFQMVWLETAQTSTLAYKTASLSDRLLIEQMFPSGGWGTTKSVDKMLLSALKQTSLNKKCRQFESQFVPEAENMYLQLHMMRAALCAYLVKLSKRQKTLATLLPLFMEMWKSIQSHPNDLQTCCRGNSWWDDCGSHRWCCTQMTPLQPC